MYRSSLTHPFWMKKSIILLACILFCMQLRAKNDGFNVGLMIGYAENTIDFENVVRESINRQMSVYPKSTLKDLYKSFFQDKYGPGHIIHDTAAANRYLLNELSLYSGTGGEIAEPTGWQHNFYRVNLSVLKDNLIPYEVFLDAFIRSVNGIEPIPVEEWKMEWVQIEKIIKSMALSLPDYDKDFAEIAENLNQGNYVGHHSEAYNEAYTPHYRIISRKIFEEEILPWLKNKSNTEIN
jgi:hypothetical protein